MRQFRFDEKIGGLIAEMEQVGACRVCQMELPPRMVLAYRCPDHPDTKAGLRTKMVADPLDEKLNHHRLLSSLILNDPRTEYWKKNCRENMEFIEEHGFLSAGDVGASDYVILAGCGPSLSAQADRLNRVKNATLVATNDAVNLLPNADYMIAMDYKFTEVRTILPSPKTTLIMDLAGDSAMARMPWKEVRWIHRSGLSYWDVPEFRDIYRNYGHCPSWNDGINITYTALQWIAKVLQPKVIVLVGFEFCFDMLTGLTRCTGEMMRWNQEETNANYTVVRDSRGFPAVTTPSMVLAGQYNLVLLVFLRAHGIPTVNCTIGGALQETLDFQDPVTGETTSQLICPRRDLEEVLDEIEKPMHKNPAELDVMIASVLEDPEADDYAERLALMMDAVQAEMADLEVKTRTESIPPETLKPERDHLAVLEGKLRDAINIMEEAPAVP